MKIHRTLWAGASAVAILAMTSLAASASANQTYYPFKKGHMDVDAARPPAHVGPYLPPYRAPARLPRFTPGTWADVGNLPFAHGGWGSMLLTDGTVIMLDYCTTPAQWYKLTPDNKGKYETGTWSKIATMPSGYSPLFFSQQVLTDGRVIVNGGEYNAASNSCGGGVWTNKGALYDPVANSWTSVSPPSGWSTIGDAESVILPNGTYMLANCCDNPSHDALASISGTTVSWNSISGWSCPSGDPCNDEEGFNALPNGDLMSVDVWNASSGQHYDDWWTFNPSTDTWTLGGKTPDYLTNSGFELGPAPLMPNGKIIQFGADSHNDIFDTSSSTWSVGPAFSLSGYDCADAPAATLPDGHVLVQASPGEFNAPSHFWEFFITRRGKPKLVQTNDPAQASHTSSFESTMLLLPTGQVLWNNSQASPKEVATYTPVGKVNASWRPVVSSVSNTLTRGSTGNAISGSNFNGFDLGAYYGDDAQSATNYPIVRFTNNGTGDVCFARSYNFSTMGVWTTGTTNAVFDIPANCESGASTLQVVVNGIASTGTAVTLN